MDIFYDVWKVEQRKAHRLFVYRCSVCPVVVVVVRGEQTALVPLAGPGTLRCPPQAINSNCRIQNCRVKGQQDGPVMIAWLACASTACCIYYLTLCYFSESPAVTWTLKSHFATQFIKKNHNVDFALRSGMFSPRRFSSTCLHGLLMALVVWSHVSLTTQPDHYVQFYLYFIAHNTDNRVLSYKMSSVICACLHQGCWAS